MRRAIFGFVAAWGLTLPCFGATLTVDLNGGADYTDIQSAIDAAADGDTVLVKPGEYVVTEPINFNRLHNPENPASPPVKNITVKSEGGAEVTTIRMSETPTNPERASVVVFEKGEDATSALVGLTLVGGRGTLASYWGSLAGGGVYCRGSSPCLMKCTISGNSAHIGGGVSFAEDSSSTLTNSTVSWNWAMGAGGGVFTMNSSPLLSSCTIIGNQATVILPDGDKGANGGGAACYGASPTFTNCTISGNSSFGPAGGAGLSCVSSAPTLTSCIISGNSALSDGGGLACVTSSPTLTNCTISGNSATSGGGLACREGPSQPTLANCIVWDNANGAMDIGRDSQAVVYSCCIEVDPIWPGESNMNDDPLFVQQGQWEDCFTPGQEGCIEYWNSETGDSWHRWIAGDYHLQPGSHCIDAGTSEGAPTTDIEGKARPCGVGVDIGAYEYGDCPGPGPRFRRGDSNADGVFDISDTVATLGFLFLGTKAPSCLDAADSNDSGVVDLSDAVYSLQFLFIGGPAPESPFPGCGIDPVIDDLDCASYPHCATGE